MGRSVSTPTAYHTYYHLEDDDYESDWLVEHWQSLAMETWPSLWECDKWLGREDHAIAENNLAYFGVSFYAGVVCIWLWPKDNDYYAPGSINNLAIHWCQVATARLRQNFGNLRDIGTMSNGERVYERIPA